MQNEFFGDSFDNSFGRLNEVGIWSCQPTGRNEWVGFSTSIEVEQDGEYVIGTAVMISPASRWVLSQGPDVADSQRCPGLSMFLCGRS